jgi:glycosyltransferase involved in cell wall biosynthesis
MRTLRVVRRLVETGWDVTVLTSDPRTFRPGTPVEDTLVSRVPAGVRVVRAPVWRGFDALKRTVRRARHGRADGHIEVRRLSTAKASNATREMTTRGLIGRLIDLVDAALAIPDHESGWVLPALMKGLAAARGSGRPDVIYSSAPPWTGQIVARALAAALRCRWVADFRDPWSRAPWRGDRFPFVMHAAARLERLVVRRADRVLFVARGNHEGFAAHYGPLVAQKFHVIPNGCDPTEFQARHPAPTSEGLFVLLHAGSLYAGRSPAPLLRALATAIARGVVDASRFRLRFLGHLGLASNDFAHLCRELRLDHVVETVPRVPRAQSLEAMRSASALLLLQPGHTVAVPAKLYEYLASGRPILAVAEDGETADVIRRSGAGAFAIATDEEAIIAALVTVMRMARDGFEAPSRELYDGTVHAAETVRILDAVVRGDSQLAGAATVEATAQQAHPHT